MKRPFAVLLLALCLAGCELLGDANRRTVEIDYARIRDIRYGLHVQPLLDRKCAGCHAGADAAAGLRLDTWDHLVAGSAFGEALIAFDAENSLLLELATKLRPAHPAALGADTLRRDEIDFLARWIDEGARNDAGEAPYEGDREWLYVCNQDAGSISVIDLEARLVVRTVKLADFGFAGTPKPHHVAVEADGSFWYVSLIGANTVLKFNRRNELVGRTDIFEAPGLVSLHPEADLLYAGRSLSAVDPPRSIGVFRRSDMQLLDVVGVFFEKPHGLHVSPDGRYAYAVSLVTNQLAAVETATNDVSLSTFDGAPKGYLHLAIAPDSRTLYVTGQVAGQVQIFDLADPARPALRTTLDVNAAPWHPVLSPDGGTLYFGNKGANTVTVVDTRSQAVTAVLQGYGLAQPHGSTLSPDGHTLYLSNNNARGDYRPRYDLGDNEKAGTVVVINTSTGAIEKVLEVEALPTGIETRLSHHHR